MANTLLVVINYNEQMFRAKITLKNNIFWRRDVFPLILLQCAITMRKFRYTGILSASGIENICHFRCIQFGSSDLPMKLVQNEREKSHKLRCICSNKCARNQSAQVYGVYDILCCFYNCLNERCCCNCWEQHRMYSFFFRLFTSVGGALLLLLLVDRYNEAWFCIACVPIFDGCFQFGAFKCTYIHQNYFVRYSR